MHASHIVPCLVGALDEQVNNIFEGNTIIYTSLVSCGKTATRLAIVAGICEGSELFEAFAELSHACTIIK